MAEGPGHLERAHETGPVEPAPGPPMGRHRGRAATAAVLFAALVLPACVHRAAAPAIPPAPPPAPPDDAGGFRFVDVAGIANLPDVLLRYRLHVQSVSHANRQVQQQTAERIRREQLAKLGIAASDRDMVVHTTLMRGAPHTLALDVGEAEEWLVRLLHGNRQHGYLDQDVLSAVLYEIWFKLCRAHRARLRSAAGRFLRSPLAAGMPLPNRLADAARLFMMRRGDSVTPGA